MEGLIQRINSIQLSSQQRIGQGRFREVYGIGDGLCIKILKPIILKSYGAGVSIPIPGRLYTLLKYRVADINETEYANYQKVMYLVPTELHHYFGHLHGVIQTAAYGSVLAAEMITNSDGSISRDLHHEVVHEQEFWQGIDAVSQTFRELNIPHFGIGSGNFVVRRNADHGLHPVLIDYKKIGANFFPFQPWNYLSYCSSRKVDRIFERLKEKFSQR